MNGKAMTRRDLIRALATAAVTTLPAAAFGAGRGQSGKRPAFGPLLQVALVPCPDYDPGRLVEAINAGWRSTRPPDVRGKRVVIKPNIADFSAERPIHTDARLVEALILHLKTLKAREIILAEGPPHNRDTEWLFRKSGFEALAKRQGVVLIDLNYDDISPVKCVNPQATLLKELYLPKTVLSADVIISVPKMKTHRLAGITLSMKNMFGILPGIKYGWPKNTLHYNGIPLSICEINGTLKTHYSIIDGVVGMEGYGPLLGTARKAGVLVMGDNALAVDATAARVMGIDPGRVDYLAMAHKIKLGSLRREDIAVAGEKIEKVRVDFVLDPEYSFLRAPKG
jgi:uncharacterized protein (DUF362 family)